MLYWGPIYLWEVKGATLAGGGIAILILEFVGLFSYIGRTIQAKGFCWMADYFGNLFGKQPSWEILILSILGSTLIAILLLAFTWKIKPKA